jgi:hypothetical protein
MLQPCYDLPLRLIVIAVVECAPSSQLSTAKAPLCPPLRHCGRVVSFCVVLCCAAFLLGYREAHVCAGNLRLTPVRTLIS